MESKLKIDDCSSLLENPDVVDLLNRFDKMKVCSDLEGWELMKEYRGFHIYRKPMEGSQLSQYLVHGLFEPNAGITSELFYHVYKDLEYRKQWDKYVGDLRILDSINEATEDVYWLVKFPWPLANRDYVFKRIHGKIAKEEFVQRTSNENSEDNNEVFVFCCNTALNNNAPAADSGGNVRVDQYISHLVLRDDSDRSCEMMMLYFDDMRGNIPTFIVNWAISTGIPNFIDSCVQSCQNYKSYCDKNSNS